MEDLKDDLEGGDDGDDSDDEQEDGDDDIEIIVVDTESD